MPRRSKADELLDFEIAFYEKLLRADPDFIDVLIPLGEAYTRRGDYDKGLDVDRRLIRLRPEDPLVWYNLACSYSLVNQLEPALETLRRAVTLGYRDLTHLQRDPDLVNVRRVKHYRQFLESLATLAAARAS